MQRWRRTGLNGEIHVEGKVKAALSLLGKVTRDLAKSRGFPIQTASTLRLLFGLLYQSSTTLFHYIRFVVNVLVNLVSFPFLVHPYRYEHMVAVSRMFFTLKCSFALSDYTHSKVLLPFKASTLGMPGQCLLYERTNSVLGVLRKPSSQHLNGVARSMGDVELQAPAYLYVKQNWQANQQVGLQSGTVQTLVVREVQLSAADLLFHLPEE